MPKDTTSKPFQGYSSPNYTPVPDQLFDEQLPDLSGAELKVLLYIMRRTFGFKKESDNISLSQICTGITTRDGRVLDRGTGLSKDTAVRALRGLEEKKAILRIRRRSEEKGDEPTSYSLHIIPVSDNRTPPGVEIGHPLPLKSDTQETVEQNTEIQETENISNIRRASPQKYSGNGEPVLNWTTLEQTTSQRNTISQVRPPSPKLETIKTTIQQRGLASHNDEMPSEVVLARRRGRPSVAEREARQVLQQYIEDYAREFNDQAPLKSSTTRAVNLMQEAGIPLGQFIGVLHEARSITKDRTASIRSLASNGNSAWQAKNKMSYYFAVVEDLLGLKQDSGHDDMPSLTT